MAADKYTKMRQNRVLEERSYLKFVFPAVEGRLGTEFTLPFYENIKISESQSAQYQRYELLARSSSLYSYTGSPSRRIKLDFNITAPHLLDFAKDVNPMKYIISPIVDDKIKAQEEFFIDPANIDAVEADPGAWDMGGDRTVKHGAVRNATAARQRYYKAYFDKHGGNWQAKPDELKAYYEAFWPVLPAGPAGPAARFEDIKNADKSQENILNVLVWWINLIRASTKNNAENVILGPPIIRLTHGPLYNDIPCICTSYKIDPDGTAGYHSKTLLERIIGVSMELEEIRAGDLLSEYIPGHIIQKDNNAGWEALIKHNTTDPYGGTDFP